MSDYRQDIANLYSQIIKESPDSIYIRGEEIQYDSEPNYTGFLNSNGKFVISSSAGGHEDLRGVILRDYFYIEGIKKVRNKIPIKTNCDSEAELKSLVRNATDYDSFRIWNAYDIISFWSKPAKEIFEGAVNAIKALGENPMKYTYDCASDDGFDELTYDEFKTASLGSSDEFSDKKQKLTQDKRMFADYMLKRRDGD